MLLVIVGAGASYDSVPPAMGAAPWNWASEDWMPPLTKDLFADKAVFRDVLKLLPSAAPAIDRVLSGLESERSSVEQELQKLVDEAADGDPHLPRQLLEVSYYLQAVLWNCSTEWSSRRGGMTNYVTLVDALERWRHRHETKIAYVTFNYDTLLETALARVTGETLAGQAAYEKTPDYDRTDWAVFKVHGSIDWARIIRAPTAEAQGATHPWELSPYARTMEVTDDFVVLRSAWQMGVDQRLVVPAIAIPAAGKSGFVMPAAHQEQLRSSLSETTHILDIGWRGVDSDFRDCIRANVVSVNPNVPVEIVVSSASGIAEVETNLRAAGLSGVISGRPVGFTGFVRGPYLEEFISTLSS
jgi:hypothetical protein